VQWSTSGLADGPHTLKIVITGTKNPSSSGFFVPVDAFDVPPTGARVYPTVPQQGTLTFAGRDSKIAANDQLGASQMQYSTSEILTNQTINGTDVGVLYGRDGQDGETVLNYPSAPTVSVLSGNVSSTACWIRTARKRSRSRCGTRTVRPEGSAQCRSRRSARTCRHFRCPQWTVCDTTTLRTQWQRRTMRS
jgi:hypothetical protein